MCSCSASFVQRSMCLKKYCECFQAGMPCTLESVECCVLFTARAGLPECKCHSCKNFEGSELRNRVMAGDDVDSVKKRATSKLSTSFNADDDLDDPPARVPPVAAEERRSRRSSVVAASALAAAAATADNDPFRHDPYGSTTVQARWVVQGLCENLTACTAPVGDANTYSSAARLHSLVPQPARAPGAAVARPVHVCVRCSLSFSL